VYLVLIPEKIDLVMFLVLAPGLIVCVGKRNDAIAFLFQDTGFDHDVVKKQASQPFGGGCASVLPVSIRQLF